MIRKTNSPKSNSSKTDKITSRTARFSLLAALAITASACGAGQLRDTQPASNLPTDTVSTETTVAQPPVGASPETQLVAEPTTPTKPATPKPESKSAPLKSCSFDQYPETWDVEVVNIKANDPDGGLVFRTHPAPSAEARFIALNGDSFSVADYAEFGGCVVTDTGSVWWAVVGFDTETLWANSAYLTELVDWHGDGDWDVDFENEADFEDAAHGGDIDSSEDFDTVAAQVSCVYDGFASACDILAQYGMGPDTNYGLGNSLTMAPAEFLQVDCNAGDPLACAELAARI